MAFPETIHVKISSEAAGYVSISPVVTQQFSATDLIEQILRVVGKNPPRIQEILLQGTLVSGASRIRWSPIEAALEEVATALAGFPDPRPDRAFDPSLCVRAALAGGRAPIEIDRDAASRRRWLARRSFWQALMETASGLPLTYQHYSYADRADVYRAELPLEAARKLRAQARLLPYSSLEAQVRDYSYDRLELLVERDP